MNKAVEIEVKRNKILLKMPKNEADISFVRGILYSRWNKDLFLWEIPNYPGNLEKLESYFGSRISKLTKEELDQPPIISKTTIEKTELLAIITQNKRIKLLFGYVPTLIKHIKTIPYARWDSKNKWWTVPYSEQFLEEIKVHSAKAGVPARFEIEPPKTGIAKIKPEEVAQFKTAPETYKNKLLEL